MSAYDDKHFDVESSLPADVTLPDYRHARATACPTHGPQVGYRYGGPSGPLVCAVPSRDGGMCHQLLKNTVR